jgi:hypothetical protein
VPDGLSGPRLQACWALAGRPAGPIGCDWVSAQHLKGKVKILFNFSNLFRIYKLNMIQIKFEI